MQLSHFFTCEVLRVDIAFIVKRKLDITDESAIDDDLYGFILMS
jgi:hypothetical protein